MTITVLYFASLADVANKSNEVVELQANTKLPELYQQLKAQYHFDFEPSQLRVAINDEFATWDDSIKKGDTVAFIPPVAGG